MATIKAYTDLEQSKKLVEILPVESADICWEYQKDRFVGESDYKEFPQFEHAIDKRDIPCWSLAELLGVLPNENMLVKTTDGEYYCLAKDVMTKHYDNPLDACVDMIERLHELNLL